MCDICTSSEEASEVTAAEMRGAVEKGFDPFSAQLVTQSTIDEWSKGLYGEIYGGEGEKDFTPAYQEALRNWKADLVATETSAWRLCKACDSKIAPYSCTRTTPRHTAPEMAAQNNIEAMVFGDQDAEKTTGSDIAAGCVVPSVIVLLLLALGVYWFWIR